MKSGRALAVGALVFATSLLAYPQFLRSFRRPAFVVQLQAEAVSESGQLLFRSSSDAELLVDGAPYRAETTLPSGLHHLHWLRSYAGGHVRSVGHTQLLGPLQDPANPPCSTHLLVSQRFLDDGKSSPGTMAHVARNMIESELEGMSIWPLGPFRGIRDLSMRWSRFQDKDGPFSLQPAFKSSGQPLTGYLRVELDLLFASGQVPLRLSILPSISEGKLSFKLIVYARLKLKNRFYQMIARLFDGNDRVSRIIDRELQGGLRYMLDTPPSVPLGNGSRLDLEFCKGKQILFHERGFVAVPLAIRIDDRAPSPPLQAESSQPVDLALSAPLAIDIDRNGLNAIAHKLWASSLLDSDIASELARSFNEQESVQELLSLRIQSARFHLPPTVELVDGSVRLRAALRAQLRDGEKQSEATLFTQIAWPLSSWQPGERLSLALDDVQMTCTEGQRLQACYTQILEQVRANQEPLQSGLARSFSDLLSELLRRREIGDASVAASFALDHTLLVRYDAVLRAELFGQLFETQ